MTIMMRQICGFHSNAKIISTCVTLACLCFTVILVLPGAVSAAESPEQAAGHVDAKLLEGTWIRPDGGYVLELRHIENDGTLTAAYFNPRQIRVSQAIWGINEGAIRLFVELRGINYPGSKYSLRYDPVSDRLNGIYFQAVGQQIYEIEFVRNR